MNNNHEEECPMCKLTDDLVLEFGQMIKDGVHWENALRHVFDVYVTKQDEDLADLADEFYTNGFHDGLMTGIENAQNTLESLGEFMAEKIAEDEKTFEAIDDMLNAKEDVENTGVTDDIQEIIRKNQGKSL